MITSVSSQSDLFFHFKMPEGFSQHLIFPSLPFLTKLHGLLTQMHRLPPYLSAQKWSCSNTPMSRFTFSPKSFILSSYNLFIPISSYASAIYILYCFLHTYLRGCFQDEMTNINLGSSFTFIFSQRNYKNMYSMK